MKWIREPGDDAAAAAVAQSLIEKHSSPDSPETADSGGEINKDSGSESNSNSNKNSDASDSQKLETNTDSITTPSSTPSPKSESPSFAPQESLLEFEKQTHKESHKESHHFRQQTRFTYALSQGYQIASQAHENLSQKLSEFVDLRIRNNLIVKGVLKGVNSIVGYGGELTMQLENGLGVDLDLVGSTSGTGVTVGAGGGDSGDSGLGSNSLGGDSANQIDEYESQAIST